jgi:hypothetical protein
MSNNKRAGTLYETIFIADALTHGLDVSTTVGDYSQYDCIVDSNGNLSRVQIKGTKYRQSKTGFCITVGMGAKTSEKNHYAKNAFDILAALVIAEGERFWYLIPKSEIGNRLSIKLFPNPDSKGRWEKYRHGWNLICS